jgi:8-amino-7-oxononanoate synthase
VNSSRLVRDVLINQARPFIFTTAASPLAVHAVDAALDVLDANPGLRTSVHMLSARMREGLRAQGHDILKSVGPVVPWVLGSNEKACEAARMLQEQGFDVRAVRPPTVAQGTARVRVSVHANHTLEQVDGLLQKIGCQKRTDSNGFTKNSEW